MFEVSVLTRATMSECEKLGVNFSFKQCKRIVLKAIRIIEREEERKYGLCFQTSDEYRTTTYSDRTGETAVNNVIRALLTNT